MKKGKGGLVLWCVFLPMCVGSFAPSLQRNHGGYQGERYSLDQLTEEEANKRARCKAKRARFVYTRLFLPWSGQKTSTSGLQKECSKNRWEPFICKQVCIGMPTACWVGKDWIAVIPIMKNARLDWERLMPIERSPLCFDHQRCWQLQLAARQKAGWDPVWVVA